MAAAEALDPFGGRPHLALRGLPLPRTGGARMAAREWRRGRILLAGDAVHMTPPFMAQGMAQGVRDALNLARKLDRVIRCGAPDRLLDTYQQERRPHVTATTQAAMALGRDLRVRSLARSRTRRPPAG